MLFYTNFFTVKNSQEHGWQTWRLLGKLLSFCTMSMEYHGWRVLPPDSKIIPPSQQPQQYSAGLEYRSEAWPAGIGMAEQEPLFSVFVRETLSALGPALIIAIVIHLFLAQATMVEGYSMEPTLSGRQRLLIEKVSYHLHPPSRGDIVVLRSSGIDHKMLIKRVVGLPGETIEIRDGVVFINGQPLDEPYLRGNVHGNYPRTLIPADHIFVLGDNRNNSSDSRYFGPVALDDIVGHALVRYWPLQEMSLMP